MNRVKREIADLERFKEIAGIVSHYGFNAVLRRLGLERFIPFHHRVKGRELGGPEEFRKMFEELGVVFVKFGQILAERKDLIPENYAEELKDLEDNVGDFGNEKAKEIVDEEIGLTEFKEFKEEPIASASIAQVHRAKLNSGEEVAVKVRRPEIKQKVERDLDILMYMAKKADKHKNMGHSQLQRDVEQFADWTRREMNLKNETKNGKRLKKEMSDWERIRVPDMYPDYSSEKVAVMEFIDAVRCDNIKALNEMDVDFSEVAEIGVKAQLEQIFKYGFFHADPHPSNFLVDRDGKIVYLDFGIMGRLTKKKRRNVLLMIYGMISGDVDSVLDSIEKLGYKEKNADVEELRATVEKRLKDIQGKTLGEGSFTSSFGSLTLEASRKGIYMPNDLVVMGKSMATIEGIGLDVYPEYNFTEENREFLESLMRDQLDPRGSSKDLLVDMLRNKDLFTKLPSKINKKMEPENQNIEVKVENKKGNQTLAAVLVLSSLFLTYRFLDTQETLAVAAVSLILATYFLRQ